MRYKIVYDRPGRLRVRCGQNAFTREESYSILSMLHSQQGINDVQACAANGSILICYKQGCRRQVLTLLENMKVHTLPVIFDDNADQLYEIDRQFIKSAGMLFFRRYILKLFLPAPVRTAMILFRAVGFWRKGLESLLNRRLDVAVLDAAAIGGAVIQGSLSTANSIMFLLTLSGLLEDYTRRRTRNALVQSLAINVDQVWLVQEDGTDISIPTTQLEMGDFIRIRTGSLVPVDGRVEFGEAMINEASLTGEPLAVAKRPGSSVYAGCVVEEGNLIISVSALSGNTRINQIIDLIDHSEALKANIQSRADKLADSIVPFSFLGALAALVFTGNINKALAVLMVDYSCAIKLTTPISIISAMREASNRKIMIKGGKYLEAFAKADTIVFDKTGTLTEACPKVAKVLAFGEYDRDEVLRISACIEEHFPHSVARAVIEQARIEGLVHDEQHAEVEYVVAHGIATMLHGERVLIGSHHFIVEDENIPFSEEEQKIIDKEANGYSVLYLTIADRLAGAICIDDPPRKEAHDAIQGLRRRGIKKVVMLTGDREQVAELICNELGIDEYVAQALPEDKSLYIDKLKAEGHQVIMVGDGINDSPALAAADVSVAMKDSSDIAQEVADITLLKASLEELNVLRDLSQKLFTRINRNYGFILGFNSALLLGGLVGIVQPAASAVLHNLSTMGICLTSMRPCLPSVETVQDNEKNLIDGE